jgi:Protein of unknown function (DUF1566)
MLEESMMLRLFSRVILLATAIFMLIPGDQSEAALVSRAGGAAYFDSTLDITWLSDANLAATETFGLSGINAAGAMNWNTASEWIAALNSAAYLGKSDWRLPSTVQPDATCEFQLVAGSSLTPQGYGRFCRASEMGHLFYDEGVTAHSPYPFHAVSLNDYWSGTSFAPDPTMAWAFDFSAGVGYQDRGAKTGLGHVWAVRDGDIQVVPLPMSMILLLSGVAVFPIAKLSIRERRSNCYLGRS